MKTNKYLSILIAFVLLFLFIVPEAEAQCAMCRATVENNVSSGESRIGASLNSGILYLMSMPYIIFVIIGYLWYRNSKKKNGKKITFAINSKG